MIRIAITAEAFEAVAVTLPVGSMGFEPQPNERGERLIWVEASAAERLTACGRTGKATAT